MRKDFPIKGKFQVHVFTNTVNLSTIDILIQQKRKTFGAFFGKRKILSWNMRQEKNLCVENMRCLGQGHPKKYKVEIAKIIEFSPIFKRMRQI